MNELVSVMEHLAGVASLDVEQIGILFDIIKAGGPVGAKATTVLDKAMALLGQHAVETNGLVSQLFLDTIKHAKDLGITLKETNDFIVGQLKSAAGGLNQVFAGLGDSAKASFDALSKGAKLVLPLTPSQAKAFGAVIGENLVAGMTPTPAQAAKIVEAIDKGLLAGFRVTEQEVQGLGAAVVAAFGEMVSRGVSVKDALDALAPSIDLLQKALHESGQDGGAAFAQIAEMSRIAHDAILGPLLSSIQGVDQALKGLHNSGLLTQGSFSALVAVATDSFNKIVAGGGDSDSALRAIQPTLQTIWELQQEFGFAVDENTQKLLDQATAAGLVGEKFKSPQQQMIDGLDRIGDLLEAIAKGLGIDVPKAADDAQKGISDAVNKIPKDIRIHVGYDVDQPPSGQPPPAGSDTEVVSLSRGTRGAYPNFGSGTLAMLHGHERVSRPGEEFGGDLAVPVNVSVAMYNPVVRDRQGSRDLARDVADRISRKFQGRSKFPRR